MSQSISKQFVFALIFGGVVCFAIIAILPSIGDLIEKKEEAPEKTALEKRVDKLEKEAEGRAAATHARFDIIEEDYDETTDLLKSVSIKLDKLLELP